MKKIILSLLLLFSLTALTPFVFAEDSGKVDIVVHYKNWENDYEMIGSHAWGGTAGAMRPGLALPDEDGGIRFEYKNYTIGEELGFIAVKYKADEDGQQDWDAKQTGDVKVDTSKFKSGKEYHVYVFQGAETKTDEPSYLVADPDKHNLIVIYTDPTGNYGEDLGVHSWNSDVSSTWSIPSKVFAKVGAKAGVGVVGAVITSSGDEIGLLIYEGGDDTKKTGDVTYRDAIGYEEGDVVPVGTVGLAYVYFKGEGYTANDNVFYDFPEFAEAAFTFGFVPPAKDKAGKLFGTYAPNPNQVFARMTHSSESPRVDEKMDPEVADGIVKSWFTLKDSEGNVVEIEEVHYNVRAKDVDTFVLILKEDLDQQKEYVLEFDLGLEEDNKEAVIDLDLDREAPKIAFMSPSEILDKDAEERIILVPLNKKFDQNKFPGFVATDNRDGDITNLVYVPKGEFSKINTGEEGDYKILLRVEDAWGNVTEETFIFRVTKNAK